MLYAVCITYDEDYIYNRKIFSTISQYDAREKQILQEYSRALVLIKPLHIETKISRNPHFSETTTKIEIGKKNRKLHHELFPV